MVSLNQEVKTNLENFVIGLVLIHSNFNKEHEKRLRLT